MNIPKSDNFPTVKWDHWGLHMMKSHKCQSSRKPIEIALQCLQFKKKEKALTWKSNRAIWVIFNQTEITWNATLQRKDKHSLKICIIYYYQYFYYDYYYFIIIIILIYFFVAQGGQHTSALYWPAGKMQECSRTTQSNFQWSS